MMRRRGEMEDYSRMRVHSESRRLTDGVGMQVSVLLIELHDSNMETHRHTGNSD